MRIIPFASFLRGAFLFVLTACQSGPSAFNFGAYSEAERLYEKKRYKEAIEKYQEYLNNEEPQGNMAVISAYYMARSYEEIGQLERAKEIYTQIVTQHSNLIWANFSKDRLAEISRHSEGAS